MLNSKGRRHALSKGTTDKYSYITEMALKFCVYIGSYYPLGIGFFNSFPKASNQLGLVSLSREVGIHYQISVGEGEGGERTETSRCRRSS